MSDNSESNNDSLNFSLPTPIVETSNVESDTCDDKTLSTDNSVSSNMRQGIMILRPGDKGDYTEKFYSCDKISNKLEIEYEEMKLSHIFDYMNKYRTLKKLLTSSIPIIINDGKPILNNMKMNDIDGSPVLIFKQNKFKKPTNITSNYSNIFSNILSGNSEDMFNSEEMFTSLVNAMASNMNLNIRSSNSLENIDQLNDLEDESDEDIEAEDSENIVNENSSLNIVNQLLNMYGTNSTSQQSISDTAKEKYKDEIEQMKNMGLNDENKLIQAISVCDGNVEHAINYYFGMD